MPGTFDKLTGTSKEKKSTAPDAVAPGTDSNTPVDDHPILDASGVSSPADELRTSQQIREVAKELTRYGLIESSRKPNLYRVLVNEHRTLLGILEPLDLDLAIDDVRGIAFVKLRADEAESHHTTDTENDPDDWSHPLVRRQRLTLEQSLLVAILRQHYVAHEQESGVGAEDARVAVDELIPEFQIYLGDPGSESRERTRMLTLLDQLKGHGLVSEPDSHERVTIRPIIAHLASPENLQYLLGWLQRHNNPAQGQDSATLNKADDASDEGLIDS